MAELKIYLTADTQNAQQGVSKVTDSLESLRKTYIKSGEGLDSYIERVNTELYLTNNSSKGLASLEKQYKILTKELSWLVTAYGSNNEATQQFSKAQSTLAQEISNTKEAIAAQKRAMEEQRASAERVQETLKLIEDHERERAKAVEDANRASIESWRRYTDFVEKQQAKLNAIQGAKDAKWKGQIDASYKQNFDTSVGSNANTKAFYKAIGDETSYARLELQELEQQLKRVLAVENAGPTAIEGATNAYKQQREVVENLTKSTEGLGKKVGGLKFAEIFKNILKFQLVMMPIQKTIRFVSNTLTDSMKVAGEAEQVFNKLSTVFENNAAAMGQASEMAKAYGTSISTMASSLSTVGDMLQAQGMGKSASLAMSADWTQRFSDIIAFKDINMSVEEFAQNFMSGAAGNLRNFRSFGSIVKESAVNAELAKKGLSDLAGEELELEKMVIRATLALEQQKNSIGATEREWNSVLSVNRRLNEQWKQQKEYLGSMLNEVYRPLKSWLSDVLTIANKAASAVKEINSGEFTIKYKPVAEGKELEDVLENTLKGMAFNKYGTQGLSLQGKAVMGRTVAGDAQTIANMSRALGVTITDLAVAMKEIGYSVEKDIASAAEEILKKESERTVRELERTRKLQSIEESNLQDYRDNVTAMFKNSGDLNKWLGSNSFVDKMSAEYLVGGNTGSLGENTTQGIKELSAVLGYITANLPKIKEEQASVSAQRGEAWSEYLSHADVVKVGAVDTYSLKEGDSWTAEEFETQGKLFENLSTQYNDLNSTIASWSVMQDILTGKLTELYQKDKKDNARDSVKSAVADVAGSMESDSRRRALESQYTDTLSYMVDIRMQEYEYEQKYSEMLKTLTDAGYTEEEATAELAEYKDAYTQAIADATDRAESDAKARAQSNVEGSLLGFFASNEEDSRRRELEAQYSDSLSYMVDIRMQEYEYTKKYDEMLKQLTDVGFTDAEATAKLAEYKEAYSQALAESEKKAREDARANATDKVASSVAEINDSASSDTRRRALEKQYSDSMSYMIDIEMERYEYEKKYNEMLNELINAGFSNEEATNELTAYKRAYSLVLQDSAKNAKEDAEKGAKSNAKAMVENATSSINGSNAATATRRRLEVQYADELSYMVEIMMQKYEYEMKYSEMLDELTKVGYSDAEATEMLEGYKLAYAKAIEEATKYEEADALAAEEKKRTEDAQKAAEEERKKQESQREANLNAMYGVFGQSGDALKMVQNGTGFMNADLISFLAELASNLELVQKASSLLTETLVPVVDALLKPLSDTLDIIMGGLQDLLVKILDPIFKILNAVMTPLNGVLSTIFGLLGDLLGLLDPIMGLLQTILPIVVVGISAVNSLLQVLEPIIEAVVMLMNILSPIVQAVILPLVNAVKGFFELLITGFTYVEVFFKKVVGNIGLAFMNVWNAIVSVLRDIDIFGWRPFSGLGYSDTSKMASWTNLSYEEEVSKKLDKLYGTLKDIEDTNLSIKDNTEEKTDFSFLDELLAAGVINERQYNERASVRQKGLNWDTVRPTKEGYVDYSNRSTTVRGGSVVVNITGGDPVEVKRAVASALREAGMEIDGLGYRDYA